MRDLQVSFASAIRLRVRREIALRAVNGVSFRFMRVKPGLVGDSGCAKTPLARAVMFTERQAARSGSREAADGATLANFRRETRDFSGPYNALNR